MKLHNLKIRSLLLAGFGTILAVMVLLAGLGIDQMNKADAMTRKLAGESFRRASTLQEWQSIVEVNAVNTLALIRTTDPTDERFFLDSIDVLKNRSDILRKDVQAGLAGDPAALALFDAVDKERDLYRATRNAALDIKATGDTAAVRRFLDTEMAPRIQSYLKALHALMAYQQQAVAADAAHVHDQFQTSQWLQVGLTVAALLAGAGFAFWIGRRIRLPLVEAVTVAQTVARGDLSSRIEARGSNETGALMGALKGLEAKLQSLK